MAISDPCQHPPIPASSQDLYHPGQRGHRAWQEAPGDITEHLSSLPAEETLLSSWELPPSLFCKGVHLQGEEHIQVPKGARISTGNADAQGAPAVTSSPGGGDNNPCLGEHLHNGSPSSLQLNNNILLLNWTREKQSRLGR